LESDIFCVQALNQPLVTVSVMGNLGEYLAVAFYIGEDARSRFLNIHSEPEAAPADMAGNLMQMHAIHVCAVPPA